MKKFFCLAVIASIILFLFGGCVLNIKPQNTPTPTITPTITPTRTPPYPAAQATSYTVGIVSFNMRFVPGGLTFPTDNDFDTIGTPTVANDYWLAETEVTYQLWDNVKTWATTNATDKYSFEVAPASDPHGWIGRNNSGDIQQPVVFIDWREAMAWCNALTEYCNAANGTSLDCVYYNDSAYTTPIRSVNDSATVDVTAGTQDNPYVKPAAKGFRLPTNNEWELAARYQDGTHWTPGNHISGDTTGYCFPADGSSTVFGNYAWYPDNSGSTTKPVGAKTANALGLYDMSGNADELCFDWHPDHLNGARVSRGGSVIISLYYLQIGSVTFREPNYPFTDLSFRIAKSE